MQALEHRNFFCHLRFDHFQRTAGVIHTVSGESPANGLLLRVTQEGVKCLDDPPQVFRRAAVFEPEQGFDRGPYGRRRVQLQTCFVDQVVSQARAVRHVKVSSRRLRSSVMPLVTAPMIPGTYQGYWKLMDPEGRLFGIGPNGDAPFWIKIQVIQSETETPLPSPTVLPTAEALVSGKVDLKMGDVLDLDTGNIDPGNGDLSLELSQNGNLLLAPQNKTELYYFGPNPPQIWQCSLGVFNPAPLDLNTIMPGSNVCFHSSQNLPGYFMINTDRSAEGIIGINYVTWSRP